jgi:hypothetical protein
MPRKALASPQYKQELTAGLRSQFSPGQRPVIIRISCLEPLLDEQTAYCHFAKAGFDWVKAEYSGATR